ESLLPRSQAAAAAAAPAASDADRLGRERHVSSAFARGGLRVVAGRRDIEEAARLRPSHPLRAGRRLRPFGDRFSRPRQLSDAVLLLPPDAVAVSAARLRPRL